MEVICLRVQKDVQRRIEMKKFLVAILLFVLLLFVPNAALAHNPDGSLTESEIVAIDNEENTIYQMQLSIVWALQQTPISWLVIWIAQIVIEEANHEIDAIENH